MTTLPQTTPMRLPRPSGAGQIAIPSASNPAAAAPAVAGVQMTGSDVWRVIRTNWWLILGSVVVMAVAGFFANGYLEKHYPLYTAAGVLKVQLSEEVFSRQADDAVAASPQSIEVELKTQAQGLLQPGLMLDTLTDSEKLRATSWFQNFKGSVGDAKEDLLKRFNVRPVSNTRLITVEMTAGNAQDARAIVEEISNRYIRNRQNNVSESWRGKAQQLEDQRATIARDYKRVSDELTDRSTKTGSKESFDLYGRLESTRYELSRLQDSRSLADRDFVQADNAYRSMMRLVESGETPPEVEAEVLRNPGISDYQREVDDLDSKLASLQGTNSPQAQSTLRRKQQVEQRRDDQLVVLRNAYFNEKKFEIETKRDSARSARDGADARAKELRTELLQMQAAAADYKIREEQQKTLKVKLDDVEEELEKYQVRRLPSNWKPVDWFQNVPTPETPSFPKLSMVMPVAILIGLALSLGIAFLREITDTTVRSPRDIARVGQLNLLGMIPHESDDPQAAGARIPLVIFDAPHSMAAEEFRKLRTRLQHTASLDSTRSLLVSSANPGDGKTTVACNLAAGLALNGRRILLVDANFRRPEIHNLFEVANEKGFSDALNDLATFDTLVRDTAVQNLYVMPTGPKPVNATELLESQLLIDFIERALEDYDHVIFDSGPLLIVSETMALAPRVDGVVTVVRARTNTRGVLQRMRDMLRQVKAEHLGVVLNAVRSRGGGYYGRTIKTYYAYQNT